MVGEVRTPGAPRGGEDAPGQVRAPRGGRGRVGRRSQGQSGALKSVFRSPKSPYQRLSQWMLDISGDQGVLKDVIREGAGELVMPDASVLGTAALAGCHRPWGKRTGGLGHFALGGGQAPGLGRTCFVRIGVFKGKPGNPASPLQDAAVNEGHVSEPQSPRAGIQTLSKGLFPSGLKGI